jgi:transcriptional regulator with XRE-family HTH domain
MGVRWDVVSIGKRLRALRDERGWSLRTAGTRAGLSHTHVGKLEEGEIANLSITTLARLAAAYRVSVADLIGASLEETEPEREAQEHMAQWEREEQEMLRRLGERFGPENALDILYRIYQLDPGQLDAIRSLIDSFAPKQRPPARGKRRASGE